jgi:hypothetical protein
MCVIKFEGSALRRGGPCARPYRIAQVFLAVQRMESNQRGYQLTGRDPHTLCQG